MNNSERNSQIFLDYHSTTPVDPRVADVAMHYMLHEYGNASSVQHAFGTRASGAVESARRELLNLVSASSSKVIFTSGATESINLVFQGLAKSASPQKRLRVALLPVEHSAVMQCVQHFVKRDLFDAHYLTVSQEGVLDLEDLDDVLKEGVDIVCVMAANNEIGNVYPLREVGELCARHSVPLFCDATQAIGKIPVSYDDWQLGYMIASAHKMYGPKGIGALVCRRELLPAPQNFGGEQEFKVRPGTLNVPLIAAFGEACRLRVLEMQEDEASIKELREHLKEQLFFAFPEIIFNGDQTNKLAGNLHFSLPDIPNDVLVARLANKVALSTGSACYAGVEQPSHVLRALGLSQKVIDGAIRVGLGKFTTKYEIEQVIKMIKVEVSAIRKLLKQENALTLSG